MSDRSVTHATFVIQRAYDASPERVFTAFADPAAKVRWFRGPEEWGADQHEIDFRVGGRETSRGGPPGGQVHTFDCRYQDIVPNQRIVFTYDMHLDDQRISVSLATIEFKPSGGGALLTYTEQGAFLDGWDNPAGREEGMGEVLDQLGAMLTQESER